MGPERSILKTFQFHCQDSEEGPNHENLRGSCNHLLLQLINIIYLICQDFTVFSKRVLSCGGLNAVLDWVEFPDAGPRAGIWDECRWGGDGRMDFMRRISFPTWPCPRVVGKVWRQLRRQPRTSSSCPPVPARPRCRCIWRGRPSWEGSLGRRQRRCLLQWVSQGFRPKTLKEDKVNAIMDYVDVQPPKSKYVYL